MKREIKTVNGTPNKRMYWSIISDYSLNTAICELVDNALDIWLKGQKTHLKITIHVDVLRQVITILDYAGGVAAEDHQMLISPGASNNDPEDQIIGLFGVGSKRAVVALAQDVKIYSRHKDDQSYEIDIYEDWLKSDSWELPVYEIDGLEENTTQIELTKLRIHPSEEDVTTLKTHLSETYAFFLKKSNFEMVVNDEPLAPVEFDSWAYPPGFEARCYIFEVITEDGRKVGVEINAGLSREKEPGREDYGVYFCCNERLIAKEIKEKEVGYISAHAGIPHSDASLARVIVKLYGPARLMPWNSSKSARSLGMDLFLHPIRHSFQANFIPKIFKGDTDTFKPVLDAMNGSANASINKILVNTQPFVTQYNIPLFVTWIATKTGDPTQFIDEAFELRSEGPFAKSRKRLEQLEWKIAEGKFASTANKLVEEVNSAMEAIVSEYGANTNQGISLSSVITLWNVGTLLSGLPKIPNINVRVPQLEFIKHLVPVRGFKAIYRSLVSDLVEISHLGKYHEIITSKIVLEKGATDLLAKEEQIEFKGVESHWKIPM